MKMIKLDNEWILGKPLGSGGFGRVFSGTSKNGKTKVAIKFIEKIPGADRELLFANQPQSDWIVPVIECGEVEDELVLVMPCAEKSLRDYLDQSPEGKLKNDEAVSVAADIASGLIDTKKQEIVHRDIKPENILLLDGKWRLSDFGIARYAETTTATDTRKYALSAAYTPPERWRHERATYSSDLYSVGIVLYELVSGKLPFKGPGVDDFREQHLHTEPVQLTNVPVALASLTGECLIKAPEARPTVENFQNRIQRAIAPPASAAFEKLQEADQAAIAKASEAERQASEARTKAEKRLELFTAAEQTITTVADDLRKQILEGAASAKYQGIPNDPFFTINLNDASINFAKPRQADREWDGWEKPVIDVVAFTSIGVQIPIDQYGYEGRSHSLWFCDAENEGEYKWYETAFMVSPFVQMSSSFNPFSLDPGSKAAKALSRAMTEFQVAWKFTPLTPGDCQDFYERWIAWFGSAAMGELSLPSQMPEHDVSGWRS